MTQPKPWSSCWCQCVVTATALVFLLVTVCHEQTHQGLAVSQHIQSLGVLLVSACCDTAQALVLLLVSVCCDTAQALVFVLVSVGCDTAQALVLLLVSALM